MNEMKPILSRWLLPNYMTVKSFTSWESVKLFKFRVPVYKGVSFPRIKRNRSFNDDWSQLPWKDSVSEKWVLNNTTLGFPFIKGFPSHEWNETHPLTMATGLVLGYVERRAE